MIEYHCRWQRSVISIRTEFGRVDRGIKKHLQAAFDQPFQTLISVVQLPAGIQLIYQGRAMILTKLMSFGRP